MRIAVIGAGIAGAALTAALHRRGHDVQLYERAPQIRAGGLGITLFPNALTALAMLGYGEEIERLRRQQPRAIGGQRAPDGRWLSRIPADVVAESLAVARSDLHELLLAPVPAERIHVSHRLSSAADDGTLTLATPSGEVTQSADLIVGADGARSTVRAGWPADPGPRSAGYGAWRGVTDEPVDLGGVAGETWGVKTRFGYAPLVGGRVYWFAVRTPAAGDPDPGALPTMRAAVEGWHAPIAQLIDATDPSAIRYDDLADLACPLPSYVRGRTVLIGDAAHAMTPNLGQGAAQGLEDAAVLAEVLAPFAAARPDDASLGSALAAFDRRRRKRSQMIARQSRLVGAVAHATGPRTSRLRDGLLRLMPDALLQREVGRVTRWDG